MISVAIYGKKDCCLCDEAKETLARVARDFPLEIKEVDISADPEIHARYREEIPVVTINGERAFRYKVHEATLRKKLERILK